MKKVVISGMLGNGLEWYDFALYGHFVTIIGRLFFPDADPLVRSIAAFGVFAAGFFMRPLGAVLFGYIGDRYGRRAALSISILTMAIPTAMIGLLPSYEQIGMMAPILLVIIRLLQGLSLGGAFSGSIAFVVEHAPENRRGLAGSTAMISMNLGILAGSAVAALFANLMPDEAFQAWGWRIPFVLGLAVAAVGLYIRNHVQESPAYLKAKEDGHISPHPVREIFTEHLGSLMNGIVVYIMVTIPFYTFVIFMHNYMTQVLGKPFKESITINTISLIISTAILPIAGMISDRIGRKPLLVMACSGFILLTYPVFYMLSQPGFVVPLVGQVLFGILVAFYMGPVPAVLVELFPTRVRFTGVALSYNISAALLGGTVPAVAMWLIHKTGNNFSLAYYIMGFAVLTFIGLNFFYEDKARKLQVA
jgi:MHS family proline/betaine transporter-like MFS transporter